MQKKLLLFGGTGFVGSVVAQKALLRGFRVVVATRSGVPDPGSPLDHLARRVQLLGGRAAAAEAALGTSSLPPQQSLDARKNSTAAGAAAPLHGDNSLVDYAGGSEDSHALECVSLDASSRAQVFHFMHDHPDATAVVNAVGLLTRNYEDARQMNGDVNTHICAGVCHEKLMPAVRKLVYVSAEPYAKYMPRTIGSKRMFKGYSQGKHIGEQAVLRNLGQRGVVLRPGFIYGTRYAPAPSATGGGDTVVPIPLWLIGKPLDVLLTALGGRKLLTPPVDVEMVAETVMRAVDWAGMDGRDVSGVVDVWRMKQICALQDPTAPHGAQPAPPGAAGTGAPAAGDAAAGAQQTADKQ